MSSSIDLADIMNLYSPAVLSRASLAQDIVCITGEIQRQSILTYKMKMSHYKKNRRVFSYKCIEHCGVEHGRQYCS